MSVRLIALLYMMLTVAVVGQTAPRPSGVPATGTLAERPAVRPPSPQLMVQHAIAESTIEFNGKAFPRISAKVSARGASADVCCTLGQTRQRDVLFKTQYTGYNESKNKQYGPDILIEGTDPCWVISNYKRVELSAAGKFSASVSHQPANFHLLQSSTFSNEYQNVRSYILSLDIPDFVKAALEAKADVFVKNYSSAAQSISTSNAIVQHVVTLWGAGWGNGRSWYDGYVNITETCCPPEVRDSAALRTTLRAWVDETAKKYKDFGRSFEALPPPVH